MPFVNTWTKYSLPHTMHFQMMMLMVYVDRICARLGKGKEKESIEWTADGKTFVIWHVKHFTSTWLPMFFGQLKFSSFIRKLYRWGFKKITVCLPGKDDRHGKVLCFGNENFQNNDLTLLTKMRSVTEPKYRRKKPSESHSIGMHQSITNKAPADRCVSHRYDLTPKPSQPPVGRQCTSVEPTSYSHFLIPVQSSRSRAGQSVSDSSEGGPKDSNGRIQTCLISQRLSAPPVSSHHQCHASHQHEPEDRSLTTSQNQMEGNTPTYEEQLVAQVISLYQSQHSLGVGLRNA